MTGAPREQQQVWQSLTVLNLLPRGREQARAAQAQLREVESDGPASLLPVVLDRLVRALLAVEEAEEA